MTSRLLALLAAVLRWLLAFVRKPAPAPVPGPVWAGPMRWPQVARAFYLEALRRPGVDEMTDLQVVTLFGRMGAPNEQQAELLVRAWLSWDQGERAASVRRMRAKLATIVRPGINHLEPVDQVCRQDALVNEIEDLGDSSNPAIPLNIRNSGRLPRGTFDPPFGTPRNRGETHAPEAGREEEGPEKQGRPAPEALAGRLRQRRPTAGRPARAAGLARQGARGRAAEGPRRPGPERGDAPHQDPAAHEGHARAGAAGASVGRGAEAGRVREEDEGAGADHGGE